MSLRIRCTKRIRLWRCRSRWPSLTQLQHGCRSRNNFPNIGTTSEGPAPPITIIYSGHEEWLDKADPGLRQEVDRTPGGVAPGAVGYKFGSKRFILSGASQ